MFLPFMNNQPDVIDSFSKSSLDSRVATFPCRSGWGQLSFYIIIL
jgi:hypothetical protein